MLISAEENDEFLLNKDFTWINSADRIDIIYMTIANSKTVLTINKKNLDDMFVTIVNNIFNDKENLVNMIVSYYELSRKISDYDKAIFLPEGNESSSFNRNQLNKKYESIKKYLYKICPIFTFKPDNCSFNYADKYLINAFLDIAKKHYPFDFCAYVNSQHQDSNPPDINNYCTEYNKRHMAWTLTTLLYPLYKLAYSDENVPTYTTYNPLKESYAQCSIISPLLTLIRRTIYSDTDILNIDWHFTNNFLSPASWSYNSEELICKYPYELVFQYTDLCAIFKERIISHNTLYIHAIANPKFRLFNTLMDSCTAITYKQYITKRLLCNNLKKEMDNGYAVLTTTELLESTYNKLVPAISHSPHTYAYANAAEIISFQSFDQMLCLFIEEILRYDKYLLCCPTCNKLFLTSSQKIRYCAEHRNQKKNYQANYIRSKVESNSFSSMFNNYKNTLFQRKKRNPELESNYKNWEENASQLLAEFQSTSSPDSQSSIDKFREELNKTVKRAGFKSIRKYRT